MRLDWSPGNASGEELAGVGSGAGGALRRHETNGTLLSSFQKLGFFSSCAQEKGFFPGIKLLIPVVPWG